mgnify:CR=1 FL=1
MEEKKREALELLKIHFGFPDFRAGQDKAISSVLSGRDTLVIMPTGGGKSLCYQLPSLVLDGVTVVVSPLIALMKDQVDSLVARGIPAASINSSLAPMESARILEAAGRGGIKLLYVAPERFYNADFIAAMARIRVGLFAVDEAHCISEWGHDFRPSYTRLAKAVKMLGRPPVIALTATATPEVRDDIVRQLNLSGHVSVINGFSRPNLHFAVMEERDSVKTVKIADIIRRFEQSSGIVYAGTRAKAEEILKELQSRNISAKAYHAGMAAEDRRQVQDSFMLGKTDVIVATNAFGLGIDKKDIRFVIHHDMPGTIEAYYQEAGRAGRDGKPSFCIMFFHPRDRYLREFFIKGDNPPPKMVLDLYQYLLSYGTDKVMATYSELKSALSSDAPEMAVGTSLKILESAGLIGRSREKNGSGYLKLFKKAGPIIESLPKRSAKQVEVLEKLENYAKNLLYEGLEFNSEDTAAALGIKRDSLMRSIKKLSDLGLAEYRPPFKGTEIEIRKRIGRSEVEIDFKVLNEKARSAYAKLDKMEEYVYETVCRQKFILDYFGDSSAAECGKCDNCVNGREKKLLSFSREASARAYDSDVHKPRPAKDLTVDIEASTKIGFSTKLPQLETYELMSRGLSLSGLAAVRGLDEETIVDHTVYLIKNKKKVDIDNYVEKSKQKRIREAVMKSGKSNIVKLKEELGECVDQVEIKIVLADIA